MMNVAKQSQMAGGMNMGFVVIAEPDEVNAARIKTILDSLDKDFSYALVGSAEAAIQLVEQNTTDVFIADMQMPVIKGTELFSMIEMMSPETIRFHLRRDSKCPHPGVITRFAQIHPVHRTVFSFGKIAPLFTNSKKGTFSCFPFRTDRAATSVAINHSVSSAH